MRPVTLAFLVIALVLPAAAGKRRSVRHPGPANVIARADAYSVVRGGTLVSAATAGVLANDTDLQATALIATLVSTTSHGTLLLNANGGFTYVNDNSAATSDAFTYKASDGSSDATATVTITVTDAPPLVVNDTYTVAASTTLSVALPGVLANDTLNGATIVSYGAATGAEQNIVGAAAATEKSGTVRLNADGSFTYTPAIASGTDTFKYMVANGGGVAFGAVSIAVEASGPDFVVTSPGFFYAFSGVSGQSPVLTLKRGRTYTFEINTDAIHPFQILNAPAGSVDNNNISDGTITFRVPAGAGTYRYHCSIHDFGNTINTTP
jgi:VCBS repeat-containing protein